MGQLEPKNTEPAIDNCNLTTRTEDLFPFLSFYLIPFWFFTCVGVIAIKQQSNENERPLSRWIGVPLLVDIRPFCLLLLSNNWCGVVLFFSILVCQINQWCGPVFAGAPPLSSAGGQLFKRVVTSETAWPTKRMTGILPDGPQLLIKAASQAPALEGRGLACTTKSKVYSIN